MSNRYSDNNDSKKTGRMISVDYDELVTLVFQAMDDFLEAEINGKSGSQLNPLKRSVELINKKGQILMVPAEVQQDAITMYFQANPDAAEYLGYDPSEIALVHDGDGDDDEDYDDYPKNQKRGKKSGSWLMLVVCVVLVVIAFLAYKKYGK